MNTFRAATMADHGALLAFVDAACATVGADASFAVRLAVEEVFTNILEHGYGGAAGPVAVSVATTAGSVRLVLDDEAATFDPAAAPRPVLDAALEEREPGGLGWHLVSELMDEVMHAPRSPRGNTYTLVKRLPAPAPAA